MSRSLIPADRASDVPLFAAVMVLVLLACLAGLAARAATQATEQWTGDLARSLTIQVVAPDTAEGHARAAALVADRAGILSAQPMSRERAQALLAPWLGPGPLPEDLPLPRLIEVELEAPAPRLADQLVTELARQGLVVRIDDHARWAGEVERTATAIRTGALAAVLLLGVAAALTASFATRASLAARRDTVETLHLLGAEDGRIASLFGRRYFVWGLVAGLTGAGIAAAGGLALAGSLTGSMVGASAAVGSFFPVSLAAADLWMLGIVVAAPLLAGLITMAAAVAAVTSALKRYRLVG
jgi:cell division transport system permease protein